jgi:Fe-S-cluster-containing dehydrogenase component
MKEIFSAVARELKKDASTDEVTALIRKHISRRQFLAGSGALGLGVAAFSILGCGSSGASSASEAPRQVFVANALGMVVSEPSRCGGCRRCELACTDFNDGVSQPSIARIKVGRNYNLGPLEAGQGFKGGGIWGNFRTVQDTCRQCPHPVPCQVACPHGAIEVIAPVNARVVNVALCAGCGICTQACPWAMTSLTGPVNGPTTKSTKCNLCNGTVKDANGNISTECVMACPTGALKYVPWSDKTKEVPPRIVVPAYIQTAVADSCAKCH